VARPQNHSNSKSAQHNKSYSGGGREKNCPPSPREEQRDEIKEEDIKGFTRAGVKRRASQEGAGSPAASDESEHISRLYSC